MEKKKKNYKHIEAKRLNSIEINKNDFSPDLWGEIDDWKRAHNYINEFSWVQLEIEGKRVFVSKRGEVEQLFLKRVSLSENNHGYIRAIIGGRTLTIHRLVMFAFKPQFLPDLNYNNSIDVAHLDNNPKNNNLDNLKVMTHRENLIQRDSPKSPRCRAIVAYNMKYKTLNKFESLKQCAEKLKLSSSNICSVLKGKMKHTCGYQFAYEDEDYIWDIDL